MHFSKHRLPSLIRRKMIFMGLLAITCLNVAPAEEKAMLIEDGRPLSKIVTAENPPRRVQAAAEELQTYLEEISGARLPVGVEPADDYPVTIYVGRSEHTEKLGLTDEGLEHGAFRMVSGPDWLVLLGYDKDFEPAEPWARNHGGRSRVQEKWEELTGGRWINPMKSLWRFRHREDRGGLGWAHDSGGSFNAVGEFLRMLGVRWYMPGELGKVIPETKSVELPDIDRTFRPDFPLRRWFGAFFAYQAEDVMWERRLRMNYGYEVLGGGMHVHGMRLIHGHPKMQQENPEYYALIGGERDTGHRGTGHACFSSEGLAREAVNFARSTFDIYDEPAVSLWPQDGYRGCQCELCEGQSASELVWGFIDRVAREVHTTHPDRLITGGAYAQYRNPPKNIDEFSPNVAVFISNVGRPVLDNDERWAEYWAFIEGWKEKLGPGRIIRNENNRYSGGGGSPVFFPIIYPRAMARDLSRMKGISLGDWNEQARTNFGQPGKTFWRAPGLDHLTLYVNARFLWDADQDLDVLLDEYYTLFYGPAHEEMKAALEFAESAYLRDSMSQPRAGHVGIGDRLKFVEKLHAAREVAGNTVYGERIELILGELEPIEKLRSEAETAEKRGDDVPVYSALLNLNGRKWSDVRNTLKLDGKIDEPFWLVWRSGGDRLSDPVTGSSKGPGTRFYTRWYQGAIHFAFRCHDDMDEPLNIPTTENNDPVILEGDHVEVMLETDQHPYYRIAVNPAGAVLDMDMGEDEGARRKWSSRADTAVYRGDDYWSVEIRIPVVGPAEGAMDPYHFVVGRPPSHIRTRQTPWYFNVGRARVRNGERQVWSYVPTGEEDLQDRWKFSSMYQRN